MNEQDAIRQKVDFFFRKKVEVHISKRNGRFYNGIILEYQGDLLILDDEVLGAVQVYLIEILDIEKRRKKI